MQVNTIIYFSWCHWRVCMTWTRIWTLQSLHVPLLDWYRFALYGVSPSANTCTITLGTAFVIFKATLNKASSPLCHCLPPSIWHWIDMYTLHISFAVIHYIFCTSCKWHPHICYFQWAEYLQFRNKAQEHKHRAIVMIMLLNTTIDYFWHRCC